MGGTPNPLQTKPIPQPDAMGPQMDPSPQADLADDGKLDTPVGPITPPDPAAVQKSGGFKGYLQGVISKIPEALAMTEAGMGNPAPLRAIQENKLRQQQAVQQQFENTLSARRENRAQQLFGTQLKNFQSEMQYRQVQQQLAEQEMLERQHKNTAYEVVQNASKYSPDQVDLAKQLLGIKPEPEQYVLDNQGRYMRLPKTGGSAPAVASPVMQNVPFYPPDFTGPKDPNAPAAKQVPLMGQVKTTGEQDQERYLTIDSALRQGQTVSPEDQAFHDSFKDLKTAGQQMLVGPRWAQVDIAKERLVQPYVKQYADAEKISQLADMVLNDVKQAGGKISGPEYMQMLTYHMAGTIGSVPGARSGIEMLHEHVRARPWDQGLEALYNSIVSGGNVTMDQIQRWAGLAHQRRDVMFQQAQRMNQLYGSNLDLNNLGAGAFAPPSSASTGSINKPAPPTDY